MQNIAVIGGSGFIGNSFCARLAKAGLRFTILDRVASKNFPEETMLADVRSVDELRSGIPSGAVIVNLAAEHRDDVRPRSLYDAVNVDGAHKICAIAREKGTRTIVFTSSVAIYGFAPIGTDENGRIAPFNDYGRTKAAAEEIFKAWQAEDPDGRCLVIVRPTVVFGERNRGNVYNLLRQIASGRFAMIGHGNNRKSMAYVENVAAFLEHALRFKSGLHIYNYVDKPDFTMNALVNTVRRALGRPEQVKIRLPYALGLAIGKIFDLLAAMTRKRFPISAIRVKKFCSNSVYGTAIEQSGFAAPVPLPDALDRTVRYEFLQSRDNEDVFHSE